MLCGLRGKIRERGKVFFAAESTQLLRPLVIRTRLVHGLACLRKRSVANAGAVGSRGCCLLGLRKFSLICHGQLQAGERNQVRGMFVS